MNVLMTCHKSYIGSVMATLFKSAEHRVVGLDTNLFDGCTFGDCPAEISAKRVDLRGVQGIDLEGFDALVHLAALSNDPLGNFNPKCTFDINHHASVRLAQLAKEAGVPRFLYASSCSLYGVAGDELRVSTPQSSCRRSSMGENRGATLSSYSHCGCGRRWH